ncbi:MAG: carbohydrate binding domain-containing protein [Terriglobales bacterium]
MRIPLTSSARKACLVLAFAFVVTAYLWLVSSQFLASYFGQRAVLASLQRAVRWQPGNAEYRDRLGRYFFLVEQSPDAAVQSYRAAVDLNPHQARYWFDLAGAYQLLGNLNEQKQALERALSADPNTPDYAWEAGNFYLVQGDTQKALREFRVVMENDPYLPPAALQLCWRVKPDIDALLREVVPPQMSVYSNFLNLLISKKETAATAKVWAQMVQMHQPLESHFVFDYLRYLIAQQEVDQARTVWQQAASMCGLSAYQPSPENLVVNGDFSLNVLNGGFDWLYQQSKEVALALDPTQSHGGHRSLLVTFDARAVNDAGIRQLVPVAPATTYDFSAYFKAEDIQGAGGPRFILQDLYTEATYFTSDELKNADFWKEASGSFTTGPATKLLVVRIERDPPGLPIRGKLWIDDVRLSKQEQPQER